MVERTQFGKSVPVGDASVTLRNVRLAANPAVCWGRSRSSIKWRVNLSWMQGVAADQGQDGVLVSLASFGVAGDYLDGCCPHEAL